MVSQWRPASGAMVLGHPLNALLWLAEALGNRGDQLRRGEIILTGTCTGVGKVAPGELFADRRLFKSTSREWQAISVAAQFVELSAQT